jgi:hypothetical protein
VGEGMNNCADNEYAIQEFLHRHFVGRLYEVPNIYLYSWESDFISVTRSGYVHEFEIKCSKADYRNDHKNKPEKHTILKHGHRELNNWEKKSLGCGYKLLNQSEITPDNKILKNRPNYFWYVCPENIITDVPDYAGLMYVKGLNPIVKKAPKLHNVKISDHQKIKLLSSMYHRYWQTRYDLRRERITNEQRILATAGN